MKQKIPFPMWSLLLVLVFLLFVFIILKMGW